MLVTTCVASIVDHEAVYQAGVTARTLADAVESPADAVLRQQRWLDHLLARVAEDFADYAAAMASAFGVDSDRLIGDKCRFLQDVALSVRERAGAMRRPRSAAEAWNSDNVSGLERRVARLLGIADFTRRDLGPVSGEGMYLVEHILLRPIAADDPMLPICTDPGCADCSDVDPYSYRVHVVLPAYAGRFQNFGFRTSMQLTKRTRVVVEILDHVWMVGA